MSDVRGCCSSSCVAASSSSSCVLLRGKYFLHLRSSSSPHDSCLNDGMAGVCEKIHTD